MNFSLSVNSKNVVTKSNEEKMIQEESSSFLQWVELMDHLWTERKGPPLLSPFLVFLRATAVPQV